MSLGEDRYFTNGVAEVVLARGAKLNYYTLQKESPQAFHVSNTHVVQGPASSFSSLVVDIGGGLVRHNLNVLLEGQEATCMLNGLSILGDAQHVDNHTFVDHARPHTTSRELYKGILGDTAHAVFAGNVLVRPDTPGTDAHQMSKTLLLSKEAEIDTKPQLEIYTDDVKCGHGAAVGQLDQEALFYLKSRGVSDQEGRSLLTHGFVTDVVGTVSSVPLHAFVDRMVQNRLREL